MVNYPWEHQRRFNAYSNYFRKQFGKRIQKVSINAGFTCPNRDGTVGVGGCTFCNNQAFTPSYCVDNASITAQIDKGIKFHETRYKSNDGFLAYFQSYSNTHDTLETIKQRYLEALNHPKIIGLVIGTRPDCIDEDKLHFFQSLTKKYYVVIEYGVESVHNDTLLQINRGHTFNDAAKAIKMTAKYHLPVGAHFILGLPGESKQQMIDSADVISSLPLYSVKFHQLQIIKGTKLEKQYLEQPASIELLGLNEYIDLMVHIIERLSPDIIIERISGEAPPQFIVANTWGLRSDQVLQLFEKKLKEKNTWQGRLYKSTSLD